MSNEVKFVFSTRYFDDLSKDEKGKAFSEPKPLKNDSPLYKFLFPHFWGTDDLLWKCFEKYKEIGIVKDKFGEYFKTTVPIEKLGLQARFNSWLRDKKAPVKRDELLKDDLMNFNIVHDEKQIESCQKDCNGEQLKSRFSYYKLKADPDSSVYAVPHLNWKPDKEWIETLIKETFDQPNNEEIELYLVLHDNDVPGYASTPYRYLTAREIYRLLKDTEYDPNNDKDPNYPRVRETDGEEVYYLEDGRRLTIIVYQHTWNDVVYLLKKSDTKYDEIKARLMTGNKKSIRDFFKIDLSSLVAKPDFSGLNPEYSVDVCQNGLIVENAKTKKEKLAFGEELDLPTHDEKEQEHKKIHVYNDNNGAFLTELMHVRTNSNSSKTLKDFIELLRKPSHIDAQKKEDEAVDIKKLCFPLIIKTYKSFFDDWAAATTDDKNKKQILSHQNKKALDENLERVFSFFNDSSIWVRLVDMYDNDAFNAAVDEFKYFNNIGLYKYDSAWENLEYNLRIFPKNYLETSLEGHSNYITPLQYGDEVDAKTILTDNSASKKDSTQNTLKTESTQNTIGKDNSKVEFDHFNDFHTVALRILLIDDKVGADGFSCEKEYTDIIKIKDKGLSVKICNKNDSCTDRGCKLCTIKRLMDNGSMDNGIDGKRGVFDGIGETKDYFYWEENDVECYYCSSVIHDFIDDEDSVFKVSQNIIIKDENSDDPSIQAMDKSTLVIHCDFEPNIKKKDGSIPKVQIVGVRDVRTALLLLSRYKFDMLFVDYLLDKKTEGDEKSGREYSIQLFEFLSKDFDKETRKAEEEADDTLKKYKENKCKLLKTLCRMVINNRGPLDKFWIMPITGFNSPFIQTLQNKNVPLINTQWHIDNGADPITTPWQFLVKLNQFIELQLKGCVYGMDTLLKFLTISGTNIKQRLPLNKDVKDQDKALFHDFQDLMGAEYSNFMMRFGARPLIHRDALTDAKGERAAMTEEEVVNYDNKSVFSTYIWRKFYTDMDDNEEAKRKKKALFSLHNLMQIFYQVAATMPEDRNGVLRLREAFRRLRYYIDINDLETTLKDKKTRDSLADSLEYFANRIDSLLVEKEEEPRRKSK